MAEPAVDSHGSIGRTRTPGNCFVGNSGHDDRIRARGRRSAADDLAAHRISRPRRDSQVRDRRGPGGGRTMTTRSTTGRTGAAVMWALVIMVVLGVMMSTAVWQFGAARQVLERRQNALQALWLARSGAELAVARLLADGDAYTGEKIELIPDSDLRITVEKDAADQTKFRIRCEARYPSDGRTSMPRALSWNAVRQTDSKSIRLEIVDSVNEFETPP